MRFRFIPNEVPAARSFGGVSNRRDPLHSGVRQQATLAPAGRRMVAGGRLGFAHWRADRRMGGGWPLSAVRFARDFIVPRVGAGGGLRDRALSLRSTGSRRVCSTAGLYSDFCSRADRSRWQPSGGILDNVALPDTHDAAGLRLRRIFYRLHGECHVPTPGTRTQTQNVQRVLSSAAVAVDSQRNRDALGSDWPDAAHARARRRYVLELVREGNNVA